MVHEFLASERLLTESMGKPMTVGDNRNEQEVRSKGMPNPATFTTRHEIHVAGNHFTMVSDVKHRVTLGARITHALSQSDDSR